MTNIGPWTYVESALFMFDLTLYGTSERLLSYARPFIKPNRSEREVSEQKKIKWKWKLTWYELVRPFMEPLIENWFQRSVLRLQMALSICLTIVFHTTGSRLLACLLTLDEAIAIGTKTRRHSEFCPTTGELWYLRIARLFSLRHLSWMASVWFQPANNANPFTLGTISAAMHFATRS